MQRQKNTLEILLPAVLMLSAMLIAVPAYADETGYTFPTAEATGTTGQGPSNLLQAFVDDVGTGATGDNYCEWFKTNNTGAGGGAADSEVYSNFGFSIPSGATIDGVEVVVSGYRTGSTSAGAYFRVRLSNNGGADWTDYGDTSGLGTTDALYTLGGSGQLWSVIWTADSFSDGNFRLEVVPAGPYLSGELWKLDSVKVKVYYTLAAGTQWAPETAWANGDPYNSEGQGNWATYTPYVADSTVTLYAGQTLPAGTVHFSAVDGNGKVTITITLNGGWRFRDPLGTTENIKIQDYEFAPSGNPNPGLFDWKAHASASPFSIVVPANNFYGVHVDVERQLLP
jgi:hypothetical protein